MVACLCRRYSLQNIEDILDIVQDTFETALVQWKFARLPENPASWLMQVAKNKAINHFKRAQKKTAVDPFELSSSLKSEEACTDEMQEDFEVAEGPLRLLFLCCHLEVSAKNKIILTLHILCGFGPAEIANALLMNEEAVKKALFRAKQLLKQKEQISYTHSRQTDLKHLKLAHIILYLMFNEGYKSTNSIAMLNHDLCYEAMRLTKLLLTKSAEMEYESNALLSLMFFNLSRFPSRVTTAGEMVSLAEQDRSQWDQTFITEGFFYLSKATAGKSLSGYHLEAIIASLHCAAKSFDETDWPKIAFLYQQLTTIHPSPLVSLNYIVAKSYIHGCEIALHELELLRRTEKVPDYTYWMAAGDFYTRIGKSGQAGKAYKNALALATSPHDKKFLEKKLLDLEE